MIELRSSTVEPVLGTLINFRGMKRIWTRGIMNANKFMIGAAIAYNLKKYMCYRAKKTSAVEMGLRNHENQLGKALGGFLFKQRFLGIDFFAKIGSVVFYGVGRDEL
jgi:hypothetical protein